MAKTLISLTVVTLAFGVAFMGCGSADETEAATPEMSDPEPVSEPAETPPESTVEWDETPGEIEIVTLDAEELVNDRCTFCHDVDRIYKAGLSPAGWEDTIDRMIARGASLNENEREAIIEYLAGF